VRQRLAHLALVLFIAVICGAPVSAGKTAAEEYLITMRHFCAWAKANAPPGNPERIDLCGSNAEYSFETTYEQQRRWWNYWQDNEPSTWQELKNKWDEELKVHYAQREREQKAARQAAAKKAREKRIAAIPVMPVPELCKMLGSPDWQPAHEELIKRKAFPASDLAQLPSRAVVLGMSEGAMLCALGAPDRTHRSVGTWGVDVQYVFPNSVFVYTRNGKVTSWQD
jgi:transketolase